MIRGTTPTLTFNLPFSVSEISTGYITFCQNRSKVLEKAMTDCVLSGTTITVTLTQNETLAFQHNAQVEIQIKLKLVQVGTDPQKVIASNIVTMDVGRILKGVAI